MITSLLFTVGLGESQLDCALDQGKRVIEYDGERYKTLLELVAACPELRSTTHRLQFAKVANFLFKGLTYEVIDDVVSFRKRYKESIEKEAKSFKSQKVRLSDFGIFNTAGMHQPHIEDDHMIFFVKHSRTQVPYQVSVPLSPEGTAASYSLLPEG